MHSSIMWIRKSLGILTVTVAYTTLILPTSLVIQPRAKKVNGVISATSVWVTLYTECHCYRCVWTRTGDDDCSLFLGGKGESPGWFWHHWQPQYAGQWGGISLFTAVISLAVCECRHQVWHSVTLTWVRAQLPVPLILPAEVQPGPARSLTSSSKPVLFSYRKTADPVSSECLCVFEWCEIVRPPACVGFVCKTVACVPQRSGFFTALLLLLWQQLLKCHLVTVH